MRASDTTPDARVRALLDRAPVMPVIALERVTDAVPLARALIAGGIDTLEVTLRSDAALDCVRAIASEVPEAVLGVGTVTRPAQLETLPEAVGFVVTPGTSDHLLAALRDRGLPTLPGVGTISESIRAREYGFRVQKLFPAAVVGGVAMVKAMAPVLPDVSLCPTGGVTPENMTSYLERPNVRAVGGSWVCPADCIAAGDWDEITRRARAAMETARRVLDAREQ